METRIKLLGHPIHPMLIVFPLGLLSTAAVFDVLYVLTGNADLAVVSFWTIAVGILGGVAAAIFGLIDWMALPRETRAKSVGRLHGGGNALVLVLFAVSLALRLEDAAYLPSALPMVLALVGAGLSLLTAWLGGELVYRLRVAVDEGAHLDASNSIQRSGVVEAGSPSDRG